MADTQSVTTRLDTGGRLVIPGRLRRAVGLAPGDEVVIVLDDQSLRILTPAQAVARAQALVGRYVAPGRSLSRELIEDRRSEAANA
jgi:AbrB family looped-hinge helix DNA binding protein